MPLMTFGKCWRGRTDCDSFHAMEAAPPGTTQEQWEAMDFIPESFICCGLINEADRTIPQDAYRLCFKNAATDEMTDNDEQDLTHLVAVMTHSLAVIATRRVNGGMIDVPTEQGVASVPDFVYGEQPGNNGG